MKTIGRVGSTTAWRRGICLFLAFLVSPLLFGDVVHLKNGKKIEGFVRDKGGDEIIVETPGGIFSFKRDTIDRIEAGSNLNNVLSQARVEEIRENYSRALELYSSALSLAESESQKNSILQQQESLIRKYVDKLSKHKVLEQGLNDIKDIEELKRKLSNPTLLAILQSAKMRLDNEVVQDHFNEGNLEQNRKHYSKAVEHFNLILKNFPEHPLAQNLDRKVTQLYVDWGEAEFKNGKSPSPESREALLAALARDPKQPKALYYLGRLEADEKRYAEAKRYLSQVNPSALPAWDAKYLTNLLARVDRALAPPPEEPQRPIVMPTPEPTPEPGTTEKLTGWIGDKWTALKSIFSSAGKGSVDITPLILEWVWILVYAVIMLTILWYAPMKILLRDLPNRRVIYHNWRKIVNYTGILGLIFYYIDRWRREEPHKRCPACNRAIDNPALFENYDFNKCPFCEKLIKPPFTLPELIQSRTQSMMMAKSFSASLHDEAQREQMLELINLVMIQGRKIRASDIHIEPEEEKLSVRYRVDGVLTESISLEATLHQFMISCIKVLCNLNIAEKRLPQDGHFRRMILGDEVNVRVSTIPTRLGEKGVLRLLDQRIASATLDQLGMRSEVLESYRTAITAPHGLILATGPTGSGKTTLQYSSLQYINDGSKNIMTVEDPIEYELGGINQIQHNQATGLTFATALRSILRQDPDVIMIGEIRDLETATIAVNAALTGHLVFSTLHTIDTSTALSRLIDIGVDVKLLSSAILCIVAQRLVRKLCPHCKKPSTATTRELKRMGVEGVLLEGQPIYRSRGCRECLDTGYLGRTGIYEMMVPNRDIREMMENGASMLDIRQVSRRVGMKTLREEGVFKILTGITSVEEIIRVTTEDVFGEENAEKAGLFPTPSDKVIPLEGQG